MKRIIYLLFLNILSSTITINAQCLIHYDTITNNYYNGITEEGEIIDKYLITNNSDENYLTWVALEPINDRTDIELVHDYLKSARVILIW